MIWWSKGGEKMLTKLVLPVFDEPLCASNDFIRQTVLRMTSWCSLQLAKYIGSQIVNNKVVHPEMFLDPKQ